MKNKIFTPDYVTQFARNMRNNMTDAEEKLWCAINNKKINGFKFMRQHPVFRYILDFYCCEKKLAIEVDGEIHNNYKAEDDYRDKYLAGCGIKTLRLNNDEIINNTEYVIDKIRKELLS